MAIKGVGKVKAVQILALGEFCKRAWERKNTRKSISFSSPDVVANYYKESIRHLEVEELRIIFLDTRQRPISEYGDFSWNCERFFWFLSERS